MKAWVLAIRPKTLPASISSVLLSSVFMWKESEMNIAYWLMILCGLAALLLQILANLVNDYADFFKGADTEERLGPTRMVQAGLISPKNMKRGIAVVLFLFLLVVSSLYLHAGWVVLVIAMVSVLFAFWYTSGNFSLAYMGLGDIFAGVFFGPVAVFGTAYILDSLLFHTLWKELFLLSALTCFYAIALMTVNNHRDRFQDKKAGKNTLAVRFGESFSKTEYILSVLLAPGISSLLLLDHSWKWFLFIVPSLILSIQAAYSFMKKDGHELNLLLATTGRNTLLTVILFSAIYLFT